MMVIPRSENPDVGHRQWERLKARKLQILKSPRPPRTPQSPPGPVCAAGAARGGPGWADGGSLRVLFQREMTYLSVVVQIFPEGLPTGKQADSRRLVG